MEVYFDRMNAESSYKKAGYQRYKWQHDMAFWWDVFVLYAHEQEQNDEVHREELVFPEPKAEKV